MTEKHKAIGSKAFVIYTMGRVLRSDIKIQSKHLKVFTIFLEYTVQRE